MRGSDGADSGIDVAALRGRGTEAIIRTLSGEAGSASAAGRGGGSGGGCGIPAARWAAAFAVVYEACLVELKRRAFKASALREIRAPRPSALWWAAYLFVFFEFVLLCTPNPLGRFR